MRLMKLGTRVLVGALFVGHGTQKLKGWFGGPGIDETTGMMDQMGMHPPRRNAYAAGLSETIGGGLLALGLFTPLAASMLTGTMAVAIKKVHASNGPWNTNGGWEYNALLIAASLWFAEDGPGDISLDHALGLECSGTIPAMAASALGATAAFGTLKAAERAQGTSQSSSAV